MTFGSLLVLAKKFNQVAISCLEHEAAYIFDFGWCILVIVISKNSSRNGLGLVSPHNLALFLFMPSKKGVGSAFVVLIEDSVPHIIRP